MPRITVGDWERRDGLKHTVLCVDAPGDCPVVGYTHYPEHGAGSVIHTAEGRFPTNRDWHSADLIRPWREKLDIDWDALPKWAVGVAMTIGGNWKWFESKPDDGICDWRSEHHYGYIPDAHAPTNYTGDWRDSWHWRPGCEPKEE